MIASSLTLALPDPETVDLGRRFTNPRRAACAVIKAFGLAQRPRVFEPRPDGYLLFGHIELRRNADGTVALRNLDPGAWRIGQSGRALAPRLLRSPDDILPRAEFLRRTEFIQKIVARHMADDPRRTAPEDRSGAMLAAALEGPKDHVAKLLTGLAFRMLDPEVRHMAFVLFGRNVTFDAYNALVRLWRAEREGRVTTLPELWRTHRPAVLLLTRSSWFRSNGLDGGITAADFHNRIESLPAALRAAGHPPSVWRMLLRMSVPQLHTIVSAADLISPSGNVARRHLHADSLAALARLGGEALPRATLKHACRIPEAHLAAYITAAKAARRQRRVKLFARGAAEVVDMLNRSGAVMPAAMTWHRLEVLSRAWHDWQARRTHAETHHQWPPVLGSFTAGACLATELTSTDMLLEEGRRQKHCVASYDRGASRGRCRLFRLEDQTTGATSTLELQPGDTGWRVAQNRTRFNAAPARSLVAFGHRVAAQATHHGLFPTDAIPAGTRLADAPVVNEADNPLTRYIPTERAEDPALPVRFDFNSDDIEPAPGAFRQRLAERLAAAAEPQNAIEPAF